jgi:hypothetical protein
MDAREIVEQVDKANRIWSRRSPTTVRGRFLGIGPLLYGMYLFSLAGTGTMHTATVANTTLNVTAYAISTASGSGNSVSCYVPAIRAVLVKIT